MISGSPVASAKPTGQEGKTLEGVARIIARRQARLAIVGAVAAGAALTLLSLLIGVWLDLMFELSPLLRVVAVAASALVLPSALCVGVSGLARRRRPLEIARRLDLAGNARGVIVSGADLHYDTPVTGSLSTALARLAVGDSAQRATRVSPSAAVPIKPVRRIVLALALLVIGVAVCALLMPRLARTEWLRLTEPYGDHPPYSRLMFDVAPSGGVVVYGDSLDIRVRVTGAPVEQIELVIEPQAGAQSESLPMFPRADGTWATTVVDIVRPVRFFARASGARSHRFDVEVVTVPKIEEVRCRVSPPEYTRHRPFEGTVPAGGITGLVGTRVELFVRSNRPLSGGRLEFRAESSDEAHRLTPNDDPSVVTGGFDITRDGTIELLVIDVEGQSSRDRFSSRVQVAVDQKPFVRITEPMRTSFATSDTRLPIMVSAEDDYGVARVHLYRSLNGSRGLPIELAAPSPPSPFCAAPHSLPLFGYGLSSGDVIKLYARVEDNDPAGPKGTESPIVTVHIISHEEYQRLMLTRQGMDVLQSKYAQARRRIEAMAEAVEELLQQTEPLPGDAPLGEDLQKKIEELTRRMQEEARAIRKSAEVSLPFDLDRDLSALLDAPADALEFAAGDLAERTAGNATRAEHARKALEAARERLGADRQQFERDAMAPLELLAELYPLMEDQARFVALYQRQVDLAQRLADLRGFDGEDNPAVKRRMRDLEGEQAHVRRTLSALLQDIVDHAEALPDDPRTKELKLTALEFAQAVRESGADGQMARAIEALAAFEGTPAAQAAKEAAETLATFISRCQNMGAQASECIPRFQPKLARSIQNTAEQLLATAGMGVGGAGVGAGGGYSAQSSTLDNVGLYGNLPTLAGAAGSGDRRDGTGLGESGLAGRGSDRPNTMMIEALRALQATGSTGASTPEPYRRRVSEYFRRIADELGDE